MLYTIENFPLGKPGVYDEVETTISRFIEAWDVYNGQDVDSFVAAWAHEMRRAVVSEDERREMKQVDPINALARRTETHFYSGVGAEEEAHKHILVMENANWQVRQIAALGHGNRIFVVYERML